MFHLPFVGLLSGDGNSLAFHSKVLAHAILAPRPIDDCKDERISAALVCSQCFGMQVQFFNILVYSLIRELGWCCSFFCLTVISPVEQSQSLMAADETGL